MEKDSDTAGDAPTGAPAPPAETTLPPAVFKDLLPEIHECFPTKEFIVCTF